MSLIGQKGYNSVMGTWNPNLVAPHQIPFSFLFFLKKKYQYTPETEATYVCTHAHLHVYKCTHKENLTNNSTVFL